MIPFLFPFLHSLSRPSLPQRATRLLLSLVVAALLVVNNSTSVFGESTDRVFSTIHLDEAIRQVIAQQDEEVQRRWSAMQVEMARTPNEFMTVTLKDGNELNGVVTVIFDDQIVINTSSGERKIGRSEVQRVSRLVRGNRQKASAVGVLTGIAVAIPLFYKLLEDKSSVEKDQRLGIAVLWGVVVGGLGGGLIGSLFGRGGSRRIVVYEAV